jgi:hypothetical protein
MGNSCAFSYYFRRLQPGGRGEAGFFHFSFDIIGMGWVIRPGRIWPEAITRPCFRHWDGKPALVKWGAWEF